MNLYGEGDGEREGEKEREREKKKKSDVLLFRFQQFRRANHRITVD